jgi:CubicO group peptidase (beta-lactamase class C family)
MEEVPLSFTPGERNAYHAMNFGHVVNELIERIDGRDCGQLLRDEVFTPLGLSDIHAGLPEEATHETRVAWCYNELDISSPARATGVVVPGVEGNPGAPAAARNLQRPSARHPETPELSHPLNRPEIHQAVLPAVGGIATARDLARIFSVLALGGAHEGVKLVSPDGLAAATAPTNREGEIDGTVGWPLRWSTGFHLGGHGDGSTLRTFGHGGAGGQEVFADPDRRLAFAFLTNGELSPDFLLWRYRLQSMSFRACRV